MMEPGFTGWAVPFTVLSPHAPFTMLQFRAAICPAAGVVPAAGPMMKNPGAATFMVIDPLPSTWEVDGLTTATGAVPEVGASNGTTKLIWVADTYVIGDGRPFTSTWTPPSVVGTGRTVLEVVLDAKDPLNANSD